MLFLARLDDEQRLLATRRILDIEWIHLDTWMALERRVFTDYCQGDFDQFRLLSRANTERMFSGVYKFFLKVGSPGFVVGQATRIWGTYFTGGDMHIIDRPDKPSAERPTRVSMTGFPNYPWFPYGVQGVMQQILDMCRATDPKVIIAKNEVKDGTLDCEFHATY